MHKRRREELSYAHFDVVADHDEDIPGGSVEEPEVESKEECEESFLKSPPFAQSNQAFIAF